MKKYKTIVIDPPWEYGKWCANLHRPNSVDKAIPYKTMKIKEIEALPINSIADENCELFLWTTQKYLPEAIYLIDKWNFKYCATITWCKKPRAGLGGKFTPTTEFLIYARNGKMFKSNRILSTWFEVKRPHNQHSKKPEFFQDMIEEITDVPRIELFARRKRKGWDVWGNEVESDIDLLLKAQQDVAQKV